MKTEQLEQELLRIYENLIQEDFIATNLADQVDPQYRLSAMNLYRYLILRNYDFRKIHDSLSELGISGMRTVEGYVFSNLFQVIKLLKLLQGKTWNESYGVETIGYKKSKKLIAKHANELFNKGRKKHFTEIMVTMPEEAATDIELVQNLIEEGMEIARINLSHGDINLWTNMVSNLKKAQHNTKKKIKIYMDLAGPKIRTTNIEVINENVTKNYIKLKQGDHLILTKKMSKGKNPEYLDKRVLMHPAEVGISIPEIIDDLNIDDPVYFDDGMIKAKVIAKNKKNVELIIIETYKSKLGSNKGINFPETHLNLPSLTPTDINNLDFVCAHADIVGYSFVRSPEDVKTLYENLALRNNSSIGVVFKIENQESFNNLPLILLEAMKRPKIGVMIARGDLAVELGYEKIAEIQKQILWLCEAAHVPVIWATQVLENLTKSGIATRAEVSDASLSVQAECVMLNKGPYIIDAVKMLRNIIIQMEGHTSKKKSMLSPLKVAQNALVLLKA